MAHAVEPSNGNSRTKINAGAPVMTPEEQQQKVSALLATIDEIKAVCEQTLFLDKSAHPAPWEAVIDGASEWIRVGQKVLIPSNPTVRRDDEMRFIAHARNCSPAMARVLLATIAYHRKNDMPSDWAALQVIADNWTRLSKTSNYVSMKLTPDEQYVLLAGALYSSYCAAVGGKAYNGDPLPNWEAFRTDPVKTVQANAWIEVARQGTALMVETAKAVLKTEQTATPGYKLLQTGLEARVALAKAFGFESNEEEPPHYFADAQKCYLLRATLTKEELSEYGHLIAIFCDIYARKRVAANNSLSLVEESFLTLAHVPIHLQAAALGVVKRLWTVEDVKVSLDEVL